VISRAESTVKATDRVVRQATQLTDQLTPIVTAAEPALKRLVPLLNPLAGSVAAEDVAAVAKLVNDLPDIVSKLDRDILPVLDTLGTVAPDLRDLLDVSKDLNEILGSLPGLGRVKRRIEDEQDKDESTREYRADEEPPPAPNRGSSS
jgi:ABC-type transporter Mla subunit MlaD